LNGGHFCLEEDAPVFSNERICWDQMMYACANHGQLCTSNLQNVVSGQVESNDLPETELSLWANGLIWGWGRWVMFDNRLGMRVERLSAR
jgi:hypothetical protein